VDAASVREALAAFSHPDKVAVYQHFFKTGPGQYGEGDIFIGVKVPDTRKVAKQFKDLPAEEIDLLMQSPVHEHRLCALVILTERFKRAKTEAAQREIFEHYLDLAYAGRINNWDLVDVTAHRIGAYLIDRPDSLQLLESLARSEKLWERRIAMIFTFAYIAANRFDVPLHIAELLLGDKHDLMHKAVGWGLREVGKRDAQKLREFLSRFAATMPRTALRYSIEKFDEVERKIWLAAKAKG
jgi:3-methyladenine DNA glycosylase AlkD